MKKGNLFYDFIQCIFFVCDINLNGILWLTTQCLLTCLYCCVLEALNFCFMKSAPFQSVLEKEAFQVPYLQTHLKKEQLKMMMNTKGCSESETKAPRGAMSPLLHSMHYKIHAYGLPIEQLIDTMCYC